MARREPIGASLLLLLALSCSQCAGPAARENVLLPAMRLAWPGVAEDVEAGIVADLAAGSLTPSAADSLRGSAKAVGAALAIGDHPSLAAAPLGAIETQAHHGIDAQLKANTIGPSGAGILRDRVRNWHDAVTSYLGGY